MPKLPDNIISHVKETAEKLNYGEITIKINKERDIIDVHTVVKDRFDKQPKQADDKQRNG
jgi:hypothetical protein